MVWLYDLVILMFGLAIRVLSTYDKKAQSWIQGRKEQVKLLSEIQNDTSPKIWMHVASLGEYEQGKPVLESIKAQFPQYKIIVSFFSPSGYEHASVKGLVDYKLYLPLDRKQKMKKFILALQPTLVILVKYDFWYHLLDSLSREKIPTILICCAMRPDQWIFKAYGHFMKEQILKITHIFSLNKESHRVLLKEGFHNITIAGDTRVDRVLKNVTTPANFDSVKKYFGRPVDLVCGSTWGKDIKILADFINAENLNVIIVPHEVNEISITEIENLIEKPCARYSRLNDLSHPIEGKSKVLIVDQIGSLSKLYRLGRIAYVGGGFGKGIHNILEPAAYGIPVMFGPNHHKFFEARDLKRLNVVREVQNAENVKRSYKELMEESESIREKLLDYFANSNGATKKILKYLVEDKLI